MTAAQNPRLGFGCSGPWAELWFAQRKALALIDQALTLGIRHFDTGNFYGGGEAERRLGAAVKLAQIDRNALTISSKTGTQKISGKLVKDFSAATMTRDIETSLTRLGTDYLDIYYLHGPTDIEIASALPVLQMFKQQGLIRAIGICTEATYIKDAVGCAGVEVVMASYNPFNQQLGEYFARAKAAGQKIVTVASAAQGLYRKGFFAPKSLPDLWYLARAVAKNRDTLARARKLEFLHQLDGWSAAQAILGWTLSNPNIDVALTTTTKPQHLVQNVLASQKPLPEEIWRKIDDAARTYP